MSVTLSVKDVLDDHVVLTTEGIDRLYLNGYVPKLQMVEGVVGFFRRHRGELFAASARHRRFGGRTRSTDRKQSLGGQSPSTA